MAKTRHCTCESQIHQNSLLSLTDSFPVLVAFYADTPRWPPHTTFENNKLCENCHISYYHSTYALYFLCCINLHLVIKDTKILNYYRYFYVTSLSTHPLIHREEYHVCISLLWSIHLFNHLYRPFILPTDKW